MDETKKQTYNSRLKNALEFKSFKPLMARWTPFAPFKNVDKMNGRRKKVARMSHDAAVSHRLNNVCFLSENASKKDKQEIS